MRANEFIVEHKTSREEFEGMTIEMVKNGHVLVINALDDWGNNILGHVAFNIGDDNDLDPQELEVDERYQGQGIARAMYDYAKSKGYTIHRSYDQTDAGAGFWNKHRGEDVRVWEDRGQGAAGIILYAEDTGRYGLQQRSDDINDPGLWAAWGGGKEPGETLEQCARRELAEEGGYTGPIKLKRIGENSKYVTFLGTIPHEFEPVPNEEWQDYCWVEAGDWPAPMHPGTAAALKNIAVTENFADGKHPEDKGDSKRYGVPTKASVSTLRKVAKQGGRKGQLAHWMANMKAGKKKANEDKEIYNYPKLDKVLDRCVRMIFDGHKKDPEKYGKVAACLIDDQNRHTYAINLPGPNGTRRHAERMAIDKHIQRYGSVGNNAIMVTTLSPCINHMSERYGESCTDLLTEFNIEKCYAGWQDPTQQPETALPFNLEVTDNAEIFNTCKDIALTFLPDALA